MEMLESTRPRATSPCVAALACAVLVAGCGGGGDGTPSGRADASGAAPATRVPEVPFPAERATVPESLPGAEPFPSAVRAALTATLRAKPADYRPRTEHLDVAGAPRFTNRLIGESSPYLRQHAHNPVNWYPWGEEAFAEARRSGRPILLSIGYSTCHWCHVMERESFEDEEIAGVLNERYVAIKVDREMRPDVDAVYIAAVERMTGRAGWPLTVWLTPELKPFYGASYLPARDGDRGVQTGFLTLLRELADRYAADPARADRLAERTLRRLERDDAAPPAGVALDRDLLAAVARRFASRYDAVHGGVAGAPKFPSDLPLRLLLRLGARDPDAPWLEIATRTLERIAAGGIHDQIGGGFHRYSVDERWEIPHFEKMLYDNARLAIEYLEAWQATGREEFADVVRSTLDYVARDMTAPGGAFYAATDADSLAPSGHPEEGAFFTWTPDEVERAVGPDLAGFVATVYGITAEGDLAGRSVPRRTSDLDAAGLRRLAPARDALLAARAARPRPHRDEKILTAWNGWMIGAFARAGAALGEPRYVEQARRAARAVLANAIVDGELRRAQLDGVASGNAFLEDHAFLIAGLLDLYEATSEIEWLDRAIGLQAELDARFRDPEGGYFRTASDGEVLFTRDRPMTDGPEPSGNSVTLMNLARLHALTTDDGYRASRDASLEAFATTVAERPTAASEMLVALEFLTGDPREVVIVTPPGRRSDAGPFLAALHRTLLPSRVVVVAEHGEDLERQAARVPLLSGKVPRGGRTTVYVCKQGVCRLPVSDVEGLAAALGG